MNTLNQDLSSLVNYGVSDQLIQDLQTIEETTDFDGRPMYDQPSIYEMRCAILCRNYARTLWEYSHYVSVIEYLHPAGVIDLFWSKGVTTGLRFKSWVEGLPALDWLKVGDQSTITLCLGKREFVMNARRVNIMAAWTVFLAIAEPNILNELSQFKQGLKESEIDAFAKKLKTRIDQYLEPHLQGLHQQRQGRVLLNWLQSQTDMTENQGYNRVLHDEAVLGFWKENALTEEGDFKRFTTVAECAYRLHQAIRIGESQRNIFSAQSLDQDKSGEAAHWLLDEVSLLNNDSWILDAFIEDAQVQIIEKLSCSPLSDIKFLTLKDTDFCDRIERTGGAAFHLPLTFIREQVFGLQQARLTEDLRKTKGENSQQLVSLDDFNGFADWQIGLLAQIDRLAQTRAALNHILLQHQHPNALANILELLDVERKTVLQSLLADTTMAASPDFIVKHLVNIAGDEMKNLGKAFVKVNRAGFKTIPDECDVVLYVEGDEYLEKLESLLKKYAEQVSQIFKLKGGIVKTEEAERLFFSQMFKSLYGNKGVEV